MARHPRRLAPSKSSSPASPARRVVIIRKKSPGGNTAVVCLLLAALAGGIYYVGSQSDRLGLTKTAQATPTVQAGDVMPKVNPESLHPSATTKNTGKGMNYIAPEEGGGDAGFFGTGATPFGNRNRELSGNGGSKEAAEETLAVTPESLKSAAASSELDGADDLILSGTAATKTDQQKLSASLLEKTIEAGAWQGYRDLLARSLVSGHSSIRAGEGRNKYDAFWKEAVWYEAMLRWKFLTALNPSKIGYDAPKRELVGWMMKNNAAMEEFLLTVKPQENPQQILNLLASYRTASQADFEKYFNLALACSVVFDRTVSIPAASSNPDFPSSVDPMKRFRWYVEKDGKGKLATAIDRMTARDLVWVVCAPVPESELDWANAKVNFSRKNWGNAYGSIEYLMERAVNGLNPYESYTLQQIEKEGGICGDQSYFCVNTARAHGIPAMTIAGETDLGGHAWAGVKVRDDEWSTAVGRIGGSANGQADNPQVGGSLSEQEVWLWNERAQQSQPTVLGVFRHLWLADLLLASDSPQDADEAVLIANQTGRAFPETWERLYAQLERKTKRAEKGNAPEILDPWVAFVADMRNEFRENPRMAEMASKAEAQYIFPYLNQEDARKALARERRRIERNSGEQKDLIAASLKREADLIHEKSGPAGFTEISNLYDKALKEYGGSITGFKKMADDYFSFVGDDQVIARKAAREIELAFKRVVETGSKDWFRANTETDIYKMICGYYRKAGDEGKAVQLEKRYQRLLKDAERGAL